MNRKFCAIVGSLLYFLWNQTVVSNYVKDIASLATCAEVKFAVQSDIFLCAVLIGVAHHEHFREIREKRAVLDIVDSDGF